MQKIDLLLERSSQIFNLFLLFSEINVHLFSLSAKTSVFIARYIVLNFEVTIHVSNFLSLSGSEDGLLIGLGNIGCLILLLRDAIVSLSADAFNRLAHRNITATKQNVARAIIMDNLLENATSFRVSSCSWEAIP